MNTSLLDEVQETYYPESDGEPMGETDLHIRLIIDLRVCLESYFREDENALVICDMLLYYEEGNTEKYIVPDVMVCFGVRKESKRVYKLWKEGRAPTVVIEISSQKTWRKDIKEKRELYERFGVEEYYVFDPERIYLKPSPFRAYRLMDGKLLEVQMAEGRIYSEALSLDLVDIGETLRLYDPQTHEYLRTHEETEAALRQEAIARKEAEEKARTEAEARLRSEKEIEALREELKRLKQKKR